MPSRFGKNTKAETIREQIIKNNRARRAFPIDAEYSFSVFEDRVTRKPRPEQIAPIIAKISKVVRIVPKTFSMSVNLVGRGLTDFSNNAIVNRSASFQGVGQLTASVTRLLFATVNAVWSDETWGSGFYGGYPVGEGQFNANPSVIYSKAASFEGSGTVDFTGSK
jgi:hypothetical protein